MSFHLEDGLLTIDQDGHSSLNTDDQMFHNITFTGLTGSFAADSHVAKNDSVVNIDTNHLIGTCNSFCTHVWGSVKFSGVEQTIPPDVWFAYEGGDLFWILSHLTGIQNPTYSSSISQIVKYRFFVSGGNVYLNERVFMNSQVTMIFPAHTVFWNLKAGRFN